MSEKQSYSGLRRTLPLLMVSCGLLASCKLPQEGGSSKTDVPEMPQHDSLGRVSTLNKMGWMYASIDPVTQQFLDESKGKSWTALEIGAAYGYLSRAALERGNTMWVNDLDERHLKIFQAKLPAELRKKAKLVPGKFPEELKVPTGYFDAITTVRVFHFFTPEILRAAIRRCYELLKPGGKVYLVTDSPYVRTFSDFIPTYEERKRAGEPFPSLITKSSVHGTRLEDRKNLPEVLHLMDPDVLRREFEAAGFIIERASFLDRKDYPAEVRWDGRESTGIIAVRPKVTAK